MKFLIPNETIVQTKTLVATQWNSWPLNKTLTSQTFFSQNFVKMNSTVTQN